MGRGHLGAPGPRTAALLHALIKFQLYQAEASSCKLRYALQQCLVLVQPWWRASKHGRVRGGGHCWGRWCEGWAIASALRTTVALGKVLVSMTAGGRNEDP